MKAADHLAGEHHYEEMPTSWLRKRLGAAGFEVISFEVVTHRRSASESFYSEWAELDWSAGITDAALRSAFQTAQQELIDRARREGLTAKTGYYACWAK